MNYSSINPKIVLLGAALMLIAALALFRSRTTPATIKDDLKTIQRDLVRQAEQLAGTLEPGSRVVVLELDFAREAHGERVYDQVVRALKTKSLNVQRVETLTIIAAHGWDTSLPGFPYAEFLRVAKAYPDAEAIIALCGPPYGLDRIPLSNSPSLPKLLVAGGVSGAAAESLCKQGRLHAATVPRTVTEHGALVLRYELLTCR
jgi:hypothetical protein